MVRAASLLALFALGCQGTRPASPEPSPIDRAVEWMAAFPADQLHFDAAIGLSAIRAVHDTPTVRRAEATARTVADADRDNPLRRAFDETARVTPASSAGWAIPAPGTRINVNRIVGEAMHCVENGLRPEAIAYATGPMRDGGGYQTTHALWALTIARDRGCLSSFATLARPLIDELLATEPAEPAREALAVDLFAERLLMLELAGEGGPRLDAWAEALLRAQSKDGGFGVLAADEDPYHRYHATLVATWALARRPTNQSRM